MRTPDQTSADTGAASPPFAGLRLLAVEDHAIGRVLLQAMLEPLGVDATLVADGRAALSAIATAAFDVIFVDLGLPDVPGDRLAERLAATPGGRRAHIVAVTGRERPRDLPPAFHDWLEKPFSVRDLHDLLAQVTATRVRSA